MCDHSYILLEDKVWVCENCGVVSANTLEHTTLCDSDKHRYFSYRTSKPSDDYLSWDWICSICGIEVSNE